MVDQNEDEVDHCDGLLGTGGAEEEKEEEEEEEEEESGGGICG